MPAGDVIERSEAGVFSVPLPGIYEHYRGGRYRLLFVAETHDHNGDLDAVYVSLTTGKACTRPVFFDSRQQDAWCDIVAWTLGANPRFRYVEP